MNRIASFFSFDRLYNYFGLLGGGLLAALGGWDLPVRCNGEVRWISRKAVS